MAHGADAVTAKHKAYGTLWGMVRQQSAMQSFVDTFRGLGVVFPLVLPFLFIMKKPGASCGAGRGNALMRAMVCLALAPVLWAADPAADLFAAAVKGDVPRIQYLLQHGADIESADKNGRTALMLAAQRGQAAAVAALLAAGAKPDARDRSGLTAYAIALFEPAGRADHDAALHALPKPPRYRISAVAGWSPARLVSSCFQQREQIIQRFGLLKPDESLLRELQAFIKSSGRGLAELASVDAQNIQPLHPDAAGGADAILLLEIQPGSACSGGTGDTLTFDIDLQVLRGEDRRLLLRKSVGGGFKNMRGLVVANASQYQPVYESWMKAQAGPIFWAAVETLMKSAP
jgi:Ankyrin repeats (many copies)